MLVKIFDYYYYNKREDTASTGVKEHIDLEEKYRNKDTGDMIIPRITTDGRMPAVWSVYNDTITEDGFKLTQDIGNESSYFVINPNRVQYVELHQSESETGELNKRYDNVFLNIRSFTTLYRVFDSDVERCLYLNVILSEIVKRYNLEELVKYNGYRIDENHDNHIREVCNNIVSELMMFYNEVSVVSVANLYGIHRYDLTKDTKDMDINVVTPYVGDKYDYNAIRKSHFSSISIKSNLNKSKAKKVKQN